MYYHFCGYAGWLRKGYYSVCLSLSGRLWRNHKARLLRSSYELATSAAAIVRRLRPIAISV